MIKSVKITDNTKLPLYYASELDNFSNGKEYNFKSGINIIIGKNGCGKSTLLNMIKKFSLCNDFIESHIPDPIIKLSTDLFDLDGELYDGVKINMDYRCKVFNFIAHKDVKNDSAVGSMCMLSTLMDNNHSSTGEQNANTLAQLFNYSFKSKDLSFPIRDIIRLSENSNNTWKENFKKLLSYYKENSFEIDEKNWEMTYLIDEPDRNLDIDKIDELFKVLSYTKEHIQLVCVIHNPILIYKLSKKKNVNFIEMTEGYLDDIKNVFKKL